LAFHARHALLAFDALLIRLRACAAQVVHDESAFYLQNFVSGFFGRTGLSRVDTAADVEHPTSVVKLARRVSAVVLSLVLLAGNAAVCAGWAPTPEARMACCAEGKSCPMHQGDAHSSGTQRVISQAQADACCAASGQEQSDQSKPAFTAGISTVVFGTSVILPASVPALVLSDGGRTAVPIPIAPIPKHVLLSVFLV
jgi:hypothetical protein